MKSKVGLAILASVLVVFSIAWYSRGGHVAAVAGPKLAIDSLEHSFGKVKPGTPLIHTFKVRNEGGENLEIKNVNPACGCTASNFDKVVAPGKEGGITLKIEHTETYRGDIVKTAEVITNDPQRRSFTLTLRANFAAD